MEENKNRPPEPCNGYLDGTGNSPFAARADHTHEGMSGGGGDYAPLSHTHKAADITDGESTFAPLSHKHTTSDITGFSEHVVPVTIEVADWQEGTSATKEIAGVKAAGPFAFIVDPADQETATTATLAYTSREDGKVTFGAGQTPEAAIKLIAFC